MCAAKQAFFFSSTKTLQYFTPKLWLREHADQEEMACISVSL